MYYADIKNYDIANGVGVRVSLFVSGCTHHCKGCFNHEAWDFHYGKPFTEDTINQIIESLRPSCIRGLSLLGGEPFEPSNQEGLLPLLRKVHEVYGDTKDIWAYSGYLFDRDICDDMMKKYSYTKELVSYLDVLVDGKFEMNLKSPNLKFRGSSNQRVIDVKQSLKQNKIIIWEGITEGC